MKLVPVSVIGRDAPSARLSLLMSGVVRAMAMVALASVAACSLDDRGLADPSVGPIQVGSPNELSGPSQGQSNGPGRTRLSQTFADCASSYYLASGLGICTGGAFGTCSSPSECESTCIVCGPLAFPRVDVSYNDSNGRVCTIRYEGKGTGMKCVGIGLGTACRDAEDCLEVCDSCNE